MKKTQWYIGTPNGVVLCVDRKESSQFSGRFYHAYSRDAVAFSNMEEAIFELEKLYDSLNFPRPTTERRSFEGKEQEHQERKKTMKMEEKHSMEQKDSAGDKTFMEVKASSEELLSRHGDLGTFIIRVQHRQNSSWQGRITWMDRNKTVYFRSIWEMIRLVAGALDTVSMQEDNQEEASWEDAVE